MRLNNVGDGIAFRFALFSDFSPSILFDFFNIKTEQVCKVAISILSLQYNKTHLL